VGNRKCRAHVGGAGSREPWSACVLDVATGSGTVAAAAEAGANVLGSISLTPGSTMHAGRGRGRRRRPLVFGDAEALPVADGAFGVMLSVLSCHLRPPARGRGGRADPSLPTRRDNRVTAWIPGGTNDPMFSVLTDYLPAPPELLTPHIIWGDPEQLRAVRPGSRFPTLTVECQWSGWRDLNSRPLDPQSSALPSCATAR
jgi:hypothetical protein